VDWVGVQREVELGLQRRLRRELQVEPLIICLVQPAPAGTPAYKGRADAEPDNRPAPRGRKEVGRDGGREAGRELSRELVRDPARVATATPAPAAAAPEAKDTAPSAEEADPSGRIRRRRSAAVAG
jgi:ribonuclease J